MRGARRVRSQARDGCEQRQVQQLSVTPGGHRRGADVVERHRQGVAAGADETGGRYRTDTERSREAADRRDDDQHAGFLHDVVARQRGEHRAKGRFPDERLAAILDIAQEDLLVADARYDANKGKTDLTYNRRLPDRRNLLRHRQRGLGGHE